MKVIGKFDSGKEFWNIYEHMKRASTIDMGCQYFCFKENIKPFWDDQMNKGGGKFSISFKKETVD